MKEHKDPCLVEHKKPKVRLLFPFNMRYGTPDITSPDQFGNQFTLLPLAMPVHVADPVERLKACQAKCDELKLSPLPKVLIATNKIGLKALSMSKYEKLTVDLFSKHTGIFTNVPGPTHAVAFAGEMVQDLMFYVSAFVGFNISIISYNGRFNVGVLCDENTGIDPNELARLFRQSFDELHDTICPPADAM